MAPAPLRRLPQPTYRLPPAGEVKVVGQATVLAKPEAPLDYKVNGMNPPAGAIASLYASGPVIGGVNQPAGAIAVRSHLLEGSATGAHAGLWNKAVMATVLGASSVGIFVPAAHAQDLPSVPTNPTALADAMRDLERRRDTMTPEQLADARKALWKSYLEATRGVSTGDETTMPTRGAVAVAATLDEIAHRMELTAYDIAHPGSYTVIDGAPGYKTLPEAEVKELLGRMIRSIPLNELPGGTALAGLVKSLPNAGSLPAESMTYDELIKALPAAQKPWLKEHFIPFYEGHKVEVIVGSFAAITATRAASPAAADVLDRIMPRMRVWKHSDPSWEAEASLRYRDRRVLPDLDLSGIAHRTVGPVTLRAVATGTVAPEADRRVTGTASVGARMEEEGRWVDLSASVDTDRRSELRLDGGLVDRDRALSLDASLVGRFGPDTAVGREASGRVSATVSLDKRFRVGRDTTGSVGFYGSTSLDTDGRNKDTHVGVLLKLNF